jgi:hypothetical protein
MLESAMVVYEVLSHICMNGLENHKSIVIACDLADIQTTHLPNKSEVLLFV